MARAVRQPQADRRVPRPESQLLPPAAHPVQARGGGHGRQGRRVPLGLRALPMGLLRDRDPVEEAGGQRRVGRRPPLAEPARVRPARQAIQREQEQPEEPHPQVFFLHQET